MKRNEKRPLVLIIDDDTDFLAATKSQLAAHAGLIVTAETAEGASWLLERVQVEVIICARRVGSADGARLLGHLGERAPAAARIMVVGSADSREATGAAAAADAVIERPVDLARLVGLIDDLVPARSEQRRTPRARVPASALVIRNDDSGGLYEVCNVSAGGALLVGKPPLEVGTTVRVSLQISTAPAIDLDARVLRGGAADNGAFAIAFIHETPETEDAIHDAILSCLVRCLP